MVRFEFFTPNQGSKSQCVLDVYPVFLKLGWKHLCFLCFWSVTKLLLSVCVSGVSE